MSEDNLQQVEKATIERVLSECAGNMSKATKRLGIDRRTLYRKVKLYRLKSLVWAAREAADGA